MKVIAAALLLTTVTPAVAQVHTLENNPTMQAQLELKWEKTHPMNNRYVSPRKRLNVQR